MIKYLKFFLFILIISSRVTSLSGQNSEGNKTLLWEIKGKGVQTPSYIFASLRMQDSCILPYSNFLYEKIQQCEAYITELQVDAVPSREIRERVMMKNKSLESILSKEDFSFIQKEYTLLTHLPLSGFSKMKPFFLYVHLMKYHQSERSKYSMSAQMLNYAKKEKKSIIELEQFKDQSDAIDSIPLSLQGKMLIFGLKNTDYLDKNYARVVQAYRQFDLDAVYSQATDTNLVPAVMKFHFFTKRNEVLTHKILEHVKTTSSFFSISTSNLWGTEGILQKLQGLGYEIRPIQLIINN